MWHFPRWAKLINKLIDIKLIVKHCIVANTNIQDIVDLVNSFSYAKQLTARDSSSTPGSQPLTAGADAGIGIGAAMGLLALIGSGLLIYRWRRRGEVRERDGDGPLYQDTASVGNLKQGVHEYGLNQGVNGDEYELPG
ncbi:MAG: hypothetical protein M1818_001955 [Claussenomyces sp. TS43310]|nr:MAG: hypothetical protein M1818_001955 [Claussenomyces sp. TS43310]